MGVILYPQYASLIHRNIGHNILSLSIFVIAGKWLVEWIARFSSRKAYLISAILVLSHVLLDSGCSHGKGIPAGVPLFWPLSSWEFSSLMIFDDYVLQPSHNWFLGHVLSHDFWRHAIINEISVSTLIYFSFIMAKITFAKVLKKSSSKRPSPIIPLDAAGPSQWTQTELDNSPPQKSGGSFAV